MITISQTPRIKACPPSGAMQQVDREIDGGAWGIAMHRALEMIPRLGLTAVLASSSVDIRAELQRLPLDQMPLGPDTMRELGVAINLRTGDVRRVDRRDPAGYQVDPDEMPGTIDVVEHQAQPLRVTDWKTGHAYSNRAGEDMQLLGYGYAAAKLLGVDEVEVAVWRIARGMKPWHDVAALDMFDLAGVLKALRKVRADRDRAAAELAAGRGVKLVEGDYCGNCPAFVVCPAKLAILRALLDGRAPEDPEPLTAYVNGKRAMDVAETAWEVVRKMAEKEPIDLGNGEYFGRRPSDGKMVKHRRTGRDR